MSRIIDYELRSRVFQLDDSENLYKMYKLYRRVEYCKDYGLSLPDLYYPSVHEDEFLFLKAFYPAEWLECEKIYNADRRRCQRLKLKIRYMLAVFRCTFLTLTFTDDVLANNSFASLRQYVVRYLCSLNCAYAANVDYGGLNGRVHYHAVVACKLTKTQLLDWILRYGAIYAKPIRASIKSSIRLSKYVSKLCNHAVKATCRRGSLLFSRNYKLPSSLAEYRDMVAPILDKGDFLCINSTPQPHRFVKLRSVSTTSRSSLVARCCMCGSIIPVLPSHMPKYTLTVQKGTKTKKYYFCSDCKELYKVKTDI